MSQENPDRISSIEARERLIAGNARFINEHAQEKDISKARRIETVNVGQKPFAAVLCCSDSRVPPELIFDQGLGDIFVIRVAGNTCNSFEAACVDYAVSHLEVPLVVIMGHTHCGAVTAFVQNDGIKLPFGFKSACRGIKRAVYNARELNPNLDEEGLVKIAVANNVTESIADLLSWSSDVQAVLKKGYVEIVGALYDMETGEVEWFESSAS